MRRLLVLVVAMWQVEMAVTAGVAASRRPSKAKPVDVPPTPAPSRSVSPRCEGPSCPPSLPQQITPSATRLR